MTSANANQLRRSARLARQTVVTQRKRAQLLQDLDELRFERSEKLKTKEKKAATRVSRSKNSNSPVRKTRLDVPLVSSPKIRSGLNSHYVSKRLRILDKTAPPAKKTGHEKLNKSEEKFTDGLSTPENFDHERTSENPEKETQKISSATDCRPKKFKRSGKVVKSPSISSQNYIQYKTLESEKNTDPLMQNARASREDLMPYELYTGSLRESSAMSYLPLTPTPLIHSMSKKLRDAVANISSADNSLFKKSETSEKGIDRSLEPSRRTIQKRVSKKPFFSTAKDFKINYRSSLTNLNCEPKKIDLPVKKESLIWEDQMSYELYVGSLESSNAMAYIPRVPTPMIIHHMPNKPNSLVEKILHENIPQCEKPTEYYEKISVGKPAMMAVGSSALTDIKFVQVTNHLQKINCQILTGQGSSKITSNQSLKRKCDNNQQQDSCLGQKHSETTGTTPVEDQVTAVFNNGFHLPPACEQPKKSNWMNLKGNEVFTAKVTSQDYSHSPQGCSQKKIDPRSQPELEPVPIRNIMYHPGFQFLVNKFAQQKTMSKYSYVQKYTNYLADGKNVGYAMTRLLEVSAPLSAYEECQTEKLTKNYQNCEEYTKSILYLRQKFNRLRAQRELPILLERKSARPHQTKVAAAYTGDVIQID